MALRNCERRAKDGAAGRPRRNEVAPRMAAPRRSDSIESHSFRTEPLPQGFEKPGSPNQAFAPTLE